MELRGHTSSAFGSLASDVPELLEDGPATEPVEEMSLPRRPSLPGI